MARIRNIGPRFFEDETMAQLPFGGRLLYIGIWTRCDMNGVFEWNVKVLTATLFPHDDGIDAAAVEGWLQALVDLGRVTRFEAAGKRYGFLPRFSAHQAISKVERDQDHKNRVLGRGFYPDPKTVFGTVSKTVPGTVPETPDEGQGTKDGGGSAADADASPPTRAQKESNRRELRKILLGASCHAGETQVEEWVLLMEEILNGHGLTAIEKLNAVSDVLAQARTRDKPIRFAREAADGLAAWIRKRKSDDADKSEQEPAA